MKRYSPELILISAGFDGCKGDQLGGMSLTPDSYAYMTRRLMHIAQKGRVIAVLEGGYNLEMISKCAETVLRVLQGEELPIEGCTEKKSVKHWKKGIKPNKLGCHHVNKMLRFLKEFFPFLDSVSTMQQIDREFQKKKNRKMALETQGPSEPIVILDGQETPEMGKGKKPQKEEKERKETEIEIEETSSYKLKVILKSK